MKLHICVFNAVYSVATKSKFLRDMAEFVKEKCCFPGTWTNAHVERLIRKKYKPEHIAGKIAIVINKSSMSAAHLENLFPCLSPVEYDIVFMGPRSELEVRDRAYAEKYNCTVISANEVIRRKLCYKLAVTMWGDHKSKNSIIKKYGLSFIAEKTLLIASIYDCTYGIEYLEKFPYDYVVCCGEFGRKLFETFGRKDNIFVLGSPRFTPKPAASDKEDRTETARRMITEQTGENINPCKKTILLLASYHSAISSLQNCASIDFLPMLKKLQDEYNIIIKPHPEWSSSWSGCRDFFLNALPKAVFLSDIDNNKLFSVADFVICDYGNSIVTTVKADKNIMLFNAPRDDEAQNHCLRDSVNTYLRDRIINFYTDEEEKFFAALKDDSVWEKQKEIRREIRVEFFADNPNPARDIAELCRRIVRGEA